jgi:hypothetical protein
MHLRRRTVASSAALAAAVAAGVLTAGGLAPALAQSASTHLSGAASATVPTTSVTAGPLQLSVPVSWAVDNPATCIRFDRSALYVGHADPAATCPAKAVGRSEAIHIEPLDASVSPGAGVPSMTSAQLAAAPVKARNTVSNSYEVALTDVKVLLTASYADDPATIERALASVRATGRTAAWTTVSPATVAGQYSSARSSAAVNAARSPRSAPAVAGGTVRSSTLAPAVTPNAQVPFNGLGFDACTAPSVGAMSAWLSSWYRAAGIYIGGPDRACGDGYLNSSWVTTTQSMGWKLIPIYVGLQAPCWPYSGGKINPAYATLQGQQAADDAVANMARFGMGSGKPVYFDMEGYDNSNGVCASAVKSFLIAWTNELHVKGYRSGVYSSAGSGIADLVTWYGNQSPDDVWFASWNNQAVTTDPVFPTAAYWPNHQRMHQFVGGHDETYNGVTINIDSNRVDSDVVGDPPRSVPPPAQPPVQPPVQPQNPLPATSDVFHELFPARIYDSGSTPLVANADRQITVTGLGGIPSSGVDAVAVNVEVTSPTTGGYIRVTPGGYSSQTGVQEFSAGQTISGLTQVRLGAGGTIRLHLSSGSARVLLDVAGYFTPSGTGDRFQPVPNARIYGTGSPQGTGAQQLVAGSDVDIPVDGRGGLPTIGVQAVVANITVASPTTSGYIRVTPGGFDSRTGVQEFVAGTTVSNLATVRIGRGGTIRLHLSQGAAAVYVDVVGYYSNPVVTTGDRFHPQTATRAYSNLALVAGSDQDLRMTGRGGLPSSGVNSVSMSVQVVAPTSAGYIRVTPGGTNSRTGVQVFRPGQTISNLVTVKLDAQGQARLHLSAGSAQVFLDVVGYSGTS